MYRIVISGGGTGGHVFPAIAIADAIKEMLPSAKILFVGALGKIEMEKVPKAGYPIIGLNIAGFQRRLTWRNLTFPFKLIISLLKALKIIKMVQPHIVVGVGGYASGPTLKMANFLGFPTLLQEQNSFAGVTNRMLAAKATTICVAYEGLERFFPKDKILLTGNPIRKDILELKIDQKTAKQTLGLNQNKKTVLIFGGSLGAKTINEAVLANAVFLKNLDDVEIICQVGKMYFDEYKGSILAQLPNVKIHAFIEDMDLVYSAADLVICRAGALTISELSLLAKAAILIPSPNVAEDHQTVNAMSLVQKNAAVLVKDAEAKEKLIPTMMELLEDDQKRSGLEKNIRYFAKPEAAKTIAAEILRICSIQAS